MTLAELANDKISQITGFTEGCPSLERLQNLGVIPGASATVLRTAPLGDPIQVRVENTLLSIRLCDAKYITVECQ